MTTVTDIPQKSRFNRLLSLFLVPALVVAGLATSALFMTKDAFASDAAGAFISGTNSYRSSAGLAPVELDGGMSSEAQAWAEYMAENSVYEHNPNGGAGSPGGATKFGENIDMGSDPGHYMYSVDRWYSSPGHQANMLDPEFTHMGAGYAVSESGEAYSVQTFASVNYVEPVAPSAPSVPTVSDNGDGTVTVSWTVDDYGTHELTSTTIAKTTNGSTATYYVGGETSIVMPATRGVESTYTVQLSSGAGDSPWSPAARYTLPAVAPSPSQISVVEVLSRNATVNLTTDNGGSPIIRYEVTLNQQPGQFSVEGETVRFTGLNRNTEYSGVITAVNEVGSSAPAPFSFTTAAELATSPQNLEATATGGTGVRVTWDAPADNGGAAVSYNVTLTSENETLTEFVSDNSATFDVVRGDTYEVSVNAENIAGVSPTVTTSVVAPITAPSEPVAANAVLGAEGQIVITWEAPADNGGAPVTGYQINGYVGDERVYSNTVDADNFFAVMNELDNIKDNTEYRFEVAALNSVATGDFVTTDTVKTPKKNEEVEVENPEDLPGVVDGLAIDAMVDYSDITLNIFWNAPVDENEEFPVIGYQVDMFDGEELILSETLAADVMNLEVPVTKAGHTYTIKVSAVNAVGAGEVSEMNFETPKTVASAPRGLTVEPEARDNTAGIKVSWNVPETNGGSDIIQYVVNIDGDVHFVEDATSITIGNLNPTTEYNVSVVAENDMGESLSSEAAGMSSMTSPSDPQNLSVTPDADKVTVTWDAPAEDGSLNNDAGMKDYIVALYQDGELIAQPTDKNFFMWLWNVFVPEEAESTIVTGETIEWTGMNSGDYTVSVRARNADNLVSNKVEAEFTVDADTPLSLKVEDLKAETTGNSVDVTWEAPLFTGEAAIDFYVFDIEDIDGNKITEITVPKNDDRAFTYEELQYDTSYVMSAVVHYTNGIISDPVYVDFRTEEKPAAEESLVPENVKVSEITDSSAKLSWDVPKEIGDREIAGYIIELTVDGVREDLILSDGPSSTLTGLEADTIYGISIKTEFLDGTYSDEVVREFKTDIKDETVKLSLEPENLEANVVDNNIVNFTWEAPKEIGDKNLVDYSYTVTNLFTGDTQTGRTTNLNASLNNLEYYTNYNIILYANYEGGERSKPVIVEFRSGDNPEPVSLTPENVKAEKAGEKSALVTWDAPKQIAGKTVIGYTLMVEGGREFTTIDEEFIFDNLKADTLYNFMVRTEFSDYTFSDFVEVEFQTDKDEDPSGTELSLKPENLKADKSGTNGVILSWDAPKEIGDKKLKGYVVSITLNGDTRSYSTTEESYKFTNLKHDTLYSFTVLAEYEDGEQSDTVAVDFKTAKKNPIIDIGGIGNGDIDTDKGTQGGKHGDKVLTGETPDKSFQNAAEDATEGDENLAMTGTQNDLIMKLSAALLLGGALVVGVSLLRKRKRGEI